jgi:delta14-sterol reductase
MMDNPITEHFEFGGPVGAFGVTTAVPFFSYALYYFCNEQVGCSALPRYPGLIFSQMWQGVLASFTDSTAWAIYFAWYAFTVACWFIIPGATVQGSELRTGKKLDYKINAFSTLVLSFAITAGIIATQGASAFAKLYDHWPGLVTASIVMSVLQAVYVYAVSFQGDKLLAKGGNSGNVLFDWFIGRELNPRIGTFDIKTFNELRPGLILWILLDISCACHQYVVLKGRVTDSMLLVCAFQAWYVVDALYNEAAIFTQMDITTDGFGFMLAVGDLTWVPFTYGLQARYLAFMPKDLGLIGTVAVLAVNAIGYTIFRQANGEKNDFRNGSNKKNLSFMTTQSGRKLLTSGWWGRSRHPNYMGDWIMAWAWCLPTAFDTPVTYFYVVFFAVLLVHRQMRDDEACTEKYGKDWAKYVSVNADESETIDSS